MMLRWISVVPPSIELARERRKVCCQRPSATAHCAAVGELAERALDLHGQLLHALVALHPHHLARGGLGTGQLALEQLGDRARAGVLEHLGVDPHLGQLLAHHRVLGDRDPVLLGGAGHVDQAVERDAQAHLQAEAEREPLVHQGGEADRPAVVETAQDLGGGHADVVEVDLVELRVAGHLLERLHGDAGLFMSSRK